MVTHRQSKTDLNNENQQFSIWIVVWYTNKLFIVVGLKTNVKGARRRSWLSWWASSLEGTWPIGGKGGSDTVEHWTTKKLNTWLEKKLSRGTVTLLALRTTLDPTVWKGEFSSEKRDQSSSIGAYVHEKRSKLLTELGLKLWTCVPRSRSAPWPSEGAAGSLVSSGAAWWWDHEPLKERIPPLSWKSYCDYLAHSLRKLTQLILEGSRMITL